MKKKSEKKNKNKKTTSSSQILFLYLFRLRRGALPDVRQQLPRQDVPREGDPLGPRDAGRRRALADIVERRLLRLHGERLLDRRPQGVEHLRVPAQVVHDVLEDLLVVREAQRAEDDHDGHVGLDVGQPRAEHRADAAAAASSTTPALGEHPHRAGRERPRGPLGSRPALGREGVLRRRLAENVDVVVRHALLGDKDLLGTVDDKVPALVERALP